jgi:hypothetical protein
MFQGGIAEWINRARASGWHEDVSEERSEETCTAPRKRPTVFEERGGDFRSFLGGWVTAFDSLSTPFTADQLERLWQQDMDAFFLSLHLRAHGRCSRAGGGQCLGEGRVDEAEVQLHASWSGRVMTSSLVEGDWRAAIRVAAVVCVYDDTTFLREVVLGLVGQLDHVVVLLSDTPWNGDVRDNTHTKALLGGILADPRLSRDRLSVVTGRWRSEGEQRQVRAYDALILILLWCLQVTGLCGDCPSSATCWCGTCRGTSRM